MVQEVSHRALAPFIRMKIRGRGRGGTKGPLSIKEIMPTITCSFHISCELFIFFKIRNIIRSEATKKSVALSVIRFFVRFKYEKNGNAKAKNVVMS